MQSKQTCAQEVLWVRPIPVNNCRRTLSPSVDQIWTALNIFSSHTSGAKITRHFDRKTLKYGVPFQAKPSTEHSNPIPFDSSAFVYR